MRHLLTALSFFAALLGSGEARAATVSQESAFASVAMVDSELDLIRGGAPLIEERSAAVRTIAEDQARSDFAGTAQIARTIADNWLNDVGAQLIVDNFAPRP